MTRPFGDLSMAKVLVIGHDPRLQDSTTVADYAFFADYYFKPIPRKSSDKAKYNFASRLFQYVTGLTNMKYRASEFYVTNLCNTELRRMASGTTVYIPQDEAEKGVYELRRALREGRFELILAMSLQVNYWLQKLKFCDVDERFLVHAEHRLTFSERGIYKPKGLSPFLRVCGRRFNVDNTPLFPILHVKQYPFKGAIKNHYEPLLMSMINTLK